MTKIQANVIHTEAELKEAFAIREEVFVIEQEVAPEEEYDEFEETSRHFLSTVDDRPAGTARWRFTDKGIKLERFAVRKAFRGQGVGASLVQAVLDDIAKANGSSGKLLYLHAQLDAMPLYAKFGFEKVGDMFIECDIKHFKMQRYL